VLLDAQHDLVRTRLRSRLDLDLDARLVLARLAFLLSARDGKNWPVRLAVEQIGDLGFLDGPQRRSAGTRRHTSNRDGKQHRRPHHTRSTKLSTTFFSPALSKSTVSLLPSTCRMRPYPNF